MTTWGTATQLAAGAHNRSGAVVPPTGRRGCDNIGIFGNDNGCKFPVIWGIPILPAVRADDWTEPIALPTGRCAWETTGTFGKGTSDGCELPSTFGFRLVVDVADWPELIALPTGRRSCESSGILDCKLPAMWGIPTAAVTDVGADVLCGCAAGLKTQRSDVEHRDEIRIQFCSDGTNSKGHLPLATP